MYNFDNIKAYVLRLGQFEETDKLDLQIQMLIEEAMAYCYRKDVPPHMELPLADVIVNELNRRSLLVIDGNVTSYREGDMSINFGGEVNANGANVKYGGKLEPFKKIIGVVKCSDKTCVQ